MRLPRKRAAAGPALGRSPLPRRPRLGCGEIPGEARAFPAFFRQRPECRNQTRRACRSCLLSESTRYQGLGIASPCLTRMWSRLWAQGSACPGQAPSRSGSFLGFVHVVRLFFLWHRTGASRAARCLGTGGRREAGGGETGPRHLERTRVHLRLGVKGAWDPQRKWFPVHRPRRQPSGPPTGPGRKWDLDTFGQLLWLFHPRNLNAAFFFCAS